MRRQSLPRRLGNGLQIAVACVVFLTPILWMISASLKPTNEVTRYPPTLIFQPTLDNFRALFATTPFLRYLANSIVIAGGSTLLGLVLAVPATFAVSWYRTMWPATIALFTRIAPATLFVLPWFVAFTKLGLIGGYSVMILTHTVLTLPLIMWVLLPHFDAVPRSILESAFMDGCGPLDCLVRIGIPLVRPGLAVASILAFIGSWNFFLFALVLGSIDTKTLIVLSFNFVGEGSTDWGRLMAAAVLIAAPPVILVSIIQRGLVAGLTDGAIKE